MAFGIILYLSICFSPSPSLRFLDNSAGNDKNINWIRTKELGVFGVCFVTKSHVCLTHARDEHYTLNTFHWYYIIFATQDIIIFALYGIYLPRLCHLRVVIYWPPFFHSFDNHECFKYIDIWNLFTVNYLFAELNWTNEMNYNNNSLIS